MRRSDLQADALAYMYAHEFVDEAIDESELSNPLAHGIEFPTKAPLSPKVIDRNEVAEKVVFCALADLVAQHRLLLEERPVEHVLGQRWLCRLLQLCGYPRSVLLVKRDGSFAASPLNSHLLEVFESLLQPGSDFISEPWLPVRRLLTLLFKLRTDNRDGEEKDPYHDILQWVGEELIEEGFYTDSTDVAAGAVPFREAHPDLEQMRGCAGEVQQMRERLERFARREPALYAALKTTVARTMKELSTLYSRRYTL